MCSDNDRADEWAWMWTVQVDDIHTGNDIVLSEKLMDGSTGEQLEK